MAGRDIARVAPVQCNATVVFLWSSTHSTVKSGGHMEGLRLAQNAACLELLYSMPHMLVLVCLHE